MTTVLKRDEEIKAKLRMLEFYEELEKRAKRFPPNTFIPFITNRIRESWGDVKKLSQTPPHVLAHVLTANCAYWKSGYNNQLDYNKFADIINIYHKQEKRWTTTYIEENIQRFFLMLRREQIPFQIIPSENYLARTWKLYVKYDNRKMSKIREIFYSTYKLKMQSWFELTYLMYVAVMDRLNYSTHLNVIKQCPYKQSTSDEIAAYLFLSSSTIDKIKEWYYDSLQTVPYEYHFLIKSILLEKPLIEMTENIYYAPFPNILLLNAGESLYRLSSGISGFHEAFGDVFEDYVKEILSLYTNIVNIHKVEKDKKSPQGKKCDFVIETASEVVLVECKATTLTAKHFTDNAILMNNSTDSVAKGLIQIFNTSCDIDSNRYDYLSIDKTKPRSGIVVTFGDIPQVNSDWYFSAFILEHRKEELKEPIYPSKNIERPIILSISALESLMILLNNSDYTISELIKQKKEMNYFEVGDWDAYLSSELSKIPNKKYLPMVSEQLKDFYHSIGLPEEIFDVAEK